MPKNDFESTIFANFEEVVQNFAWSDDDMIYWKNAYFLHMHTLFRSGFMSNLIKKSWTDSKGYTAPAFSKLKSVAKAFLLLVFTFLSFSL